MQKKIEEKMSESSNIFGDYSHYYDLLYSDKDYQGEVKYIHQLLNANGIQGKNSKILEFGSGTGIHGEMLGNLGYKVVGVEKSAEMVRRARTSQNFKCLEGDITTVILNDKFDCILSLFHVVSYITTDSGLTALFNNAANHLSKDGLFIFDTWYSPSVNFIQPAIKIKRVANEYMEILRIAEPTIHSEKNIVDVKYTIFSKKIGSQCWTSTTETHTMRHFSEPEIRYFASTNGFTLIHAEEFITSKPINRNTWGACFVIKKND
jgi:SAM-dependent methyltransferase